MSTYCENAEQFYDEKIAPELLRLAKLCEDNGLPFFAVVEFGPDPEEGDETDNHGVTQVRPGHASKSFNRLVNRAWGVEPSIMAVTVTSEKDPNG
jgi:hypothetical protein